jgi:glycosyltransferase involved in cell wall biosynthesis
MHSSIKTIIVLPAYNAAKTLEKTINDIPFDSIDEIILVDDNSRDNTVTLAHKLLSENKKCTMSPQEYKANPSLVLCTIIVHKKNTGYGGNQKTCYDTALAHGADVVIMIHPDFQYDPTAVPIINEFIQKRNFDCILGSRIRNKKEALESGMPVWKYISNRFLSSLENLVTGRVLTDWHTGMRGYRCKASTDHKNT